MSKCIMRQKERDFLIESYSEDIFSTDLTWSDGVVEVLKRGGYN